MVYKKRTYAAAAASFLGRKLVNDAYNTGKKYLNKNKRNSRPTYVVKQAWNKYNQQRVGRVPMSLGPAKREVTYTTGSASEAGRELHSELLTDIQGNVSGFGVSPDQRSRNFINISGIKVNLDLHNSTMKPLYFNMAIIHPRNTNPNTSSVPITNFFKQDDTSGGAIDFSSSLNSLQLSTLSINTDQHDVLWMKRFKINENGSATNYATEHGADTLSVREYVPVNRQVRYDNPSGTSCFDPIWLVYWSDGFHEDGISTTPNQFTAQWRVITYYRDGT